MEKLRPPKESASPKLLREILTELEQESNSIALFTTLAVVKEFVLEELCDFPGLSIIPTKIVRIFLVVYLFALNLACTVTREIL